MQNLPEEFKKKLFKRYTYPESLKYVNKLKCTIIL